MTWPSPQDYNEAIQTPSFSFDDADLKAGSPELDRFGLPKPVSGGFASVYKMRGADRDWAVRCFLHPVDGQKEHYAELRTLLAQTNCQYIVPFEFLENGIRIRNAFHPILKMNWLNGLTLNGYIEQNLCNSSTLNELHQQFLSMFADLQTAGIVHGDLQHGNIMVVDGALKLVDYDCMFIEGMSFSNSRELGHRNYQHPGRNSLHNGYYLDNFSAHVIDLSLRSLVLDPQLWHELKAGDECLLFRHRDFMRPDESRAFAILEHHRCDEIALRARALRFLLQVPIESVPALGSTIVIPADFAKMPSVNELPQTPANEHWLAGWLQPGQQPFSDSGIVVAISSHVQAETNNSAPAVCQLENINPKVRLIQTCCEYHPSLPTVANPPRAHEERIHQKQAIRQSVHARTQQNKSNNHSGFFGLSYSHTTGWAEPPTVAEQLVKVAIAGSVFLVAGLVLTCSVFSCMYAFDINGMRTGTPWTHNGNPDDYTINTTPPIWSPEEIAEDNAVQKYTEATSMIDNFKFKDAIVKLEEAVKELNDVHSQSYVLTDCHKGLGFCHEALGQYNKSLEHYKQVEKLLGPYFGSNDMPVETYDIGRVALAIGDLKTARKYLEHASSSFKIAPSFYSPGDPKSDADIFCWRDLEECYRKLGLHSKAHEAHREWVSLRQRRLLRGYFEG